MATRASPGRTRQQEKKQAEPMAVPGRTPSQSADNFAVRWKPGKNGSGEFALAYEGPLASGEALVARAGTWREGGVPWSETREVELRRDGRGRWTGGISIPNGAPLRAVEFVVRSGDSWDNGGRAPLGYYEWRLGEARVAVV